MNSDQPNIILIITDQQRYDTIRALGADWMHTPNLDRLVREGVSFDQCHCTSAVCVPSRASFFSMEYPHKVNSYGNGSPWHQCWVEDFQKAGYHTVNVGKMHTIPMDGSFGFDQRYVVENKDRPPRDHSPHGGYLDDWDRFLLFSGIEKPSRANYKANHPDWETGLGAFAWPLEEHLQPDMFVGQMAVQVINRRTATNPLFLEIGFPGPHPPYDPPQRHLELYDDVSIPIPVVTDEELAKQPSHHALQREWCLEGNHDAVNWQLKPSDDQLLRLRRHYAANVTSIDEQVGNIIAALDEKGMLENSVIVFMSDHGDCTGDHGHIQKWVMYDAVTRVPAIVWSPGRIPEGKRTDALIQHMDLAPMLFDLAGIEVPKHTGAESALPNGDTEFAGRDAVFCELKGREDYLVMVRTQEWKLVSYLENGNVGELYDLNRDPAELQNLWNDPKLSEIQMTLLDRIRIWHTAQSIGD